jgi:hypothetical protein
MRCMQILEEQQALLAEDSQCRHDEPRGTVDVSSRACAPPVEGPEVAAEAARWQPVANAGAGGRCQRPARFVCTVLASAFDTAESSCGKDVQQ